jgi:hypothetical protein
VIESGAVLKFDTDSSTNASVKVLGDLECQSQPYNPAILTCIDDDFTGDTLEGYGVSTGSPITVPSGTGPYLDLTYATNASIQNLRVCFADQGITTPLATGRLDLWDCQFLECNYGVVNLIPNATNSLHNVLFAGCGAAVGAASNSIAIEAEQVTANVENFFLGYTSASRISLTNSIIFGESSFPNLSTTHVIFNPDPTNFQSEGLANYYLAAIQFIAQFRRCGHQCALADRIAGKKHLRSGRISSVSPNQRPDDAGSAGASIQWWPA